MTIPKFEEYMLPFLKHSAEKEWMMKDLIHQLAIDFRLSEQEKLEINSAGNEIFSMRVGRAKTYLKKAGLIVQSRRGSIIITDRGREVLDRHLDKINQKTLMEFEGFRAFMHRDHKLTKEGSVEQDLNDDEITPNEQIINAHDMLQKALYADLLDAILKCSPLFFEKLIIRLIVGMGYGGSYEEVSLHLGRSGDGGIDGVINEDRLGLNKIHLQAKRYNPDSSLGANVVRDFIGALSSQKDPKRGILLTTAYFTKAAYETAEASTNTHVILIDGQRLVELMVEYNIGVNTEQTIEIKKISAEYFVDEIE